MKTIKIFFIATILFTLSAHSQITKGNWMVGGYANFSSSKSEYNPTDGSKSTSSGSGLQLSPTIGYFLIDKLVIGLSPSFSYSNPSSGDNVIGYGVGPFARYYLLKPENRINVLTHIGYSYYTSSGNTHSNNYVIKAGPVVYFNSSVGLEFTIDYSGGRSKYNDGSDFLNKSINIGLGLQVHLEK